jgi:hypothetical protein
VNRHTIKVGNSVVCWVNKRGFHSYEFSFPQEKLYGLTLSVVLGKFMTGLTLNMVSVDEWLYEH